jgi:hypothetical protein
VTDAELLARIAGALERIADVLEGKWPPPATGQRPVVDTDQLPWERMSVRVCKVLRRQNRGLDRRGQSVELEPILTYQDLAAQRASDLLLRRNFGNTCLAEVRALLAEKGMKLRGDP